MLSNISVNDDFWSLAIPFTTLGSGIDMMMPAAMNVMMSSVPKEKAGMASGTFQTSNSLESSIGISFGGAIFTRKMNELIVNFGSTIPTPQMIKMMSLLVTKGKILPLLEITDAFIKSLHAVFTTAIPIVTISLIIAALFVKGTEHLRNTRLVNKNS